MKFQPQGYEGVRARMSQLQARIDRRFPHKQPAISAPGVREGSLPSPLQGLIGDRGDIQDGNTPLSPFSPQANVKVDRAPAGIRAMINDAATAAGVDMQLFEALIGQESSYNQNSTSNRGAIGLAQLMPGTAKALGVDPHDPAQNLLGGAKYLRQMMDQFSGNVELALAAYNAGPGAVKRANGIPPYPETQDYVRKILARYQAVRKP